MVEFFIVEQCFDSSTTKISTVHRLDCYKTSILKLRNKKCSLGRNECWKITWNRFRMGKSGLGPVMKLTIDCIPHRASVSMGGRGLWAFCCVCGLEALFAHRAPTWTKSWIGHVVPIAFLHIWELGQCLKVDVETQYIWKIADETPCMHCSKASQLQLSKSAHILRKQFRRSPVTIHQITGRVQIWWTLSSPKTCGANTNFRCCFFKL